LAVCRRRCRCDATLLFAAAFVASGRAADADAACLFFANIHADITPPRDTAPKPRRHAAARYALPPRRGALPIAVAACRDCQRRCRDAISPREPPMPPPPPPPRAWIFSAFAERESPLMLLRHQLRYRRCHVTPIAGPVYARCLPAVTPFAAFSASPAPSRPLAAAASADADIIFAVVSSPPFFLCYRDIERRCHFAP